MNDIFKRLAAPFPPDKVSWRVGSTSADKKRGLALAYIDARDVQDRLDEVCGAENWQCRYPHANGKTVCEIGIRINGEWIWKADGAGDTDFEAEKGALSDAFKRAAVRWGIGRYLYDVEAPWVDITPTGKSFAIAPHEMPKLRALLEKRAGSSNKAAPSSAGAGNKERLREAYRRIADAIVKADSVKVVEDILKVNKADIDAIREESAEAAERLEHMAENRKGELTHKRQVA